MKEDGFRRPAKQLTAAQVRTAKEGKYFDGHGLFLRVTESGSRFWAQRIVVQGKRREIGLGNASLVTLAEARAKAIENRRIARSGGNPLAIRQKAKAIPTFAEAVVEAHKEIVFGNEKAGKAFLSVLRNYAVPHFGRMQIDAVSAPDVRAAVLSIREEKPATAAKLMLHLGAVFRWAIGQGFRADNPAVASNLALPAVSRKARSVAHRKALPYDQVAACISSVHASGAWKATKLALEFLILTAARSGEVRAAKWSEIDGTGQWTVPAERMKSSRAHVVPLSPRALEVLAEAEKLRDSSGLIFPSVRGVPLSDMTLSKLVKELGFAVDVHGFRTSFRTWAQERTNFPFEVCETALAHSVGDAATQAYARSDLLEKRRKLMAAWASYLAVRQGEVIAIAGGGKR